MLFKSVLATERLPQSTGFYFCKVKERNETGFSSISVLRFGDVREENNPDDKEFYANCDAIVGKERIEWLEEIKE